MINILVVDDNSNKVKNITSALNEFTQISRDNTQIASDLVSARKHLIERQFDLMILDISIPDRHGDDALADGGVGFLRELKTSKRLLKPSNIIGLTAYDDLVNQYSQQFKDDLWLIIKYDEQYDEWKKQLRNKIEYILQLKKEQQESNINYDYDLAIVTALHEPELKSVLNINANWESIKYSNDQTTYYIGQFKNESKQLRVVAAATHQMGMAATSVLTMKLIQKYRPKYIAMVGIAAGIKDENRNYGDILVADQSWDYGSGKIKYNEEKCTSYFQPNPTPIPLEPELKEKFLTLKSQCKFVDEIRKNAIGYKKPNSPLSIIIGPMGSGSSVIADEQFVNQIQDQNRKLIGIEMEAYAVFYAAANCSKPRPTPFILKSICDFADFKKVDDYQEYAAYTSAQYLYYFSLEEL